jgi:hypothetical protein
MEIKQLIGNATALEKELDWLSRVIDTRFKLYFGHENEYADISEVPAPVHNANESALGSLIHHYRMGIHERLLLILAISPHIKPEALDVFFIEKKEIGQRFTQFGGFTGSIHRGFLPTAETAAFIIAGENLSKRFILSGLFEDDHYFKRDTILRLEHDETNKNEPSWSAPLTISKEYLNYLSNGKSYRPVFSSHFPASHSSTELNWDNLILPLYVKDELLEILSWIKHGDHIRNGLGYGNHIKKGYRALFYGPPGTGKTLATTLLGKEANLEVYRIDLSKLVSKYIGETEKNLANIFDQAENKNWILFFDEADALFGQRTSTRSSNDRYANQEVSFLLQRIEDFPGVVILSSNLKGNLDQAFTRRLQSVIYFPVPDEHTRLRLWKSIIRDENILDKDIKLEKLAQEHVISGGAMINVMRYALLKASERKNGKIMQEDFITGINRERRKEGKE